MLQENFPQVDPLALEALFEANSYNYGQTVAALNASLGTAPKVAEPEEIKSPSKPKPSPKTEVAILVLKFQIVTPFFLRKRIRAKDTTIFAVKPCMCKVT